MYEALRIQNLGQHLNHESPLTYKHLPNPCGRGFRMICIAQSGGGKTNVVKNLITRDEYGYKQHFGDDIFVISETLELDGSWDDVELPEHHKTKEWDEERLDEIIKYSAESTNGTLIVFDDLVCSDAINKYRSTLLDRIFMLGRHSKVNAIFTTQKYNALSPKMRANATHTLCWGVPTVSERKMFLDDNADVDGVEERFEYATKEPFSFLYINRLDKTCFRNFEEPLGDGTDDHSSDNISTDPIDEYSHGNTAAGGAAPIEPLQDPRQRQQDRPEAGDYQVYQ